MGKARYAWITAVPMCFVGVTTVTAGVLSIKNIFWPLTFAAGPGVHRLPGFDADEDFHRRRGAGAAGFGSAMDHGAQRCAHSAKRLRAACCKSRPCDDALLLTGECWFARVAWLRIRCAVSRRLFAVRAEISSWALRRPSKRAVARTTWILCAPTRALRICCEESVSRSRLLRSSGQVPASANFGCNSGEIASGVSGFVVPSLS